LKTATYIEDSLSKKKAGSLIFTSDFYGTGTDVAIRKTLSRLAEKGTIRRLSQGMYYIPVIDPVLGELRVGADDVVQMVAQKEKIRIRPAGAYALHRLGLTTQVPTRRVYITDGHTRHFNLGKLEIKFKQTTSKKLSRKGKISGLVIQALEELGTDKIDMQTEARIRELLQHENPRILKHDLGLAAAKVNNYIIKILKEQKQ
jgi:hypothetical protein